MIYLPWIAFLLAIAWMIRQGDKAKKEYLRRREAEEQKRARAMTLEDENVEALKPQAGQGRSTELAETLGGRTPRRGSQYGSGSSLVS